MRRFVLASFAALSLLSAPVARAEEAAAPPEPAFIPRVTVQVDAVLFALSGYSWWLGVAPAPHLHVVLGTASGVIPFGLPAGWNGRVRSGTLAGVQYYPFDAANSGLYFALHLGRFELMYTRSDSPGAVTGVDQLSVVPAVGYRWFPMMSSGFYIAPFVAAGIAPYTIGEAKIGTNTLTPSIVTPLPGLYVGWEFGRQGLRR